MIFRLITTLILSRQPWEGYNFKIIAVTFSQMYNVIYLSNAISHTVWFYANQLGFILRHYYILVFSDCGLKIHFCFGTYTVLISHLLYSFFTGCGVVFIYLFPDQIIQSFHSLRMKIIKMNRFICVSAFCAELLSIDLQKNCCMSLIYSFVKPGNPLTYNANQTTVVLHEKGGIWESFCQLLANKILNSSHSRDGELVTAPTSPTKPCKIYF